MTDLNINAEDPLSRLDMVAVELHEMFMSLQRAGFSHEDSLQIISFAVADGVMLPIYSSQSVDYDENDEDYDENDGEAFLG
jgi:hypothetical protein